MGVSGGPEPFVKDFGDEVLNRRSCLHQCVSPSTQTYLFPDEVENQVRITAVCLNLTHIESYDLGVVAQP